MDPVVLAAAPDPDGAQGTTKWLDRDSALSRLKHLSKASALAVEELAKVNQTHFSCSNADTTYKLQLVNGEFERTA